MKEGNKMYLMGISINLSEELAEILKKVRESVNKWCENKYLMQFGRCNMNVELDEFIKIDKPCLLQGIYGDINSTHMQPE